VDLNFNGANMEETANTSTDKYAFGAHVILRWPGRTSLSAAQWWSGFDDYLALQCVLANHTDTKLVAGSPPNGIGATIAFEFMGGTTREVLIEKDDVNFVWRINMPDTNALFSSYVGTARVESEDATGCDVSYAIDCVLVAKDRETRMKIIDQPTPPGPTRVDELARFVLERDGVKSSFTFPVACGADALWAVVGNWGDVSWVHGATKAEVTGPDRRTVFFDDGTHIDERMWSRDDAKRTLVYEPLGSPMPVRMYLGTLTLEETGPGQTQVTYTQCFVPKDGLRGEDVKRALAEAFRARFAWVQKRFAVTTK
jgi:hypothetical protein